MLQKLKEIIVLIINLFKKPVSPEPALPPPVEAGVLTPELEKYKILYQKCSIKPEFIASSERKAASIRANLGRYNSVAQAVNKNMPGWFVGLIHMMESDFNFNTHLHNGDPLSSRTKHVPAGRPAKGNPPFAWDYSAVDALQSFASKTDWSVPAILKYLEIFNGTGYRNKGINTPYLWSFTNHYTKGKYVADGVYDSNAVSKQCGCAAVMIALNIKV